MKYWEDMCSKYGFGDGDAVPVEAALVRELYVRTVNLVAERNGSSTRAVCYDRPGCHNSVMIIFVDAVMFGTLTADQVEGKADLPEAAFHTQEPPDGAWNDAVAECADMCLDDYIDVEVKLNPSFREFLEELKADGRSAN